MLQDAAKAQVEAKKAEHEARGDEKVKETQTKAAGVLKDKVSDALKGLFGH
ncbi:hypothetical protein [Rhodoferax sp.]|uniref:hypothetical protein n=1 Tax=Rhodoferax sp. TaxID=50421 RepID=UPI00283B587C|nr:hypothetical protein [Rhodoferax sp.]MDR3368735.1 hypothetical protein [Rhodoferax sp.]